MVNLSKAKTALKKVWNFLWDDNSIWSWIANIIIAFILIKFVVYPVLGLILGTGFPIVAVVSGSMEHHGDFSQWWETQKELYSSLSITEEQFKEFPFSSGFNKGDIMVLKGIETEKLKIGDVIVFSSKQISEPVIHRVVIKQTANGENGKILVTTKGDFNNKIYEFEKNINPDNIIGRAVIKIPYLGYIKIWFVDLVRFVGIIN